MDDAISIINDPAMREQIKTRYEAGEHVVLCTELDINLSILNRWARAYGWPPSWASGRSRQELISILIQEGYTNATIARVVAISADTVRAIRHKLNTNQITSPSGGMDIDCQGVSLFTLCASELHQTHRGPMHRICHVSVLVPLWQSAVVPSRCVHH